MKKLLWFVLLAFSFSVLAPAAEAAPFSTMTATVKAKAHKKKHKKKKHHRRKHKHRKVAMRLPSSGIRAIQC